MIQRKQTVFLFLALVATLACLSLPLGRMTPDGMGADAVLYNLLLVTPDAKADFSPAFLFGLLVGSCPVNVACIALFKNRKLQMNLCNVLMLLNIAWYVCLASWVLFLAPVQGSFHPSLMACLPLISIILYAMARKGIKADEDLVRSMDRIR